MIQEAAPYLGMGLQLAAAVVVFYFVGSWADEKLNTAPWLMIAGVTVGAVGGFFQFFRNAAELSKKESTKKDDPPA